jgi:molybdate-binding protein
MKSFFFIIVFTLSLFNTSYANIVMQDLIDVLVQTNKQKSFEVAKNLKQLKQDAKTYDFVIRKANLDITMQKILQKQLKKLT